MTMQSSNPVRPTRATMAVSLAIPFGLASAALAQSPAPPPPAEKAAEKPAGTAATTPTLVEDLQTAYAWAENAKTLAESFATKADADGVPGAASLFRVGARSVGILAAQYAESIKKLGGTPTTKADTALPKVMTTKENLQAFAKLLNTRRSAGLAEAAARHRAGPNREATKTLQYEREALTELARFSNDAAETVDKLKAGKKDFFVSRPCGYVTDKLVADKCPVCKTGKDQFEKIN